MIVPSMIPFKHLDMFRFWCQKVLPTVYDDSLSYYELLGKVVKYLNDTMEDVNIAGQNVAQIYTALSDLKDYIDNFIDETDIEQIVDDKIMEMYDDGYFDELLNTYGLKDKTLLFFGDSLTWGDSGDATHSRVAVPFPAYIHELTNAHCYNYGVKSATMATITDGQFSNFDTQLDNCPNLADADYIFIMFGINDRSQNVPVGWVDNEEIESYCGALKHGLNKIAQANSHVQIVVMSPPFTRSAAEQYPAQYGATIYAYADACKTICKEYGIKYIDMLNNSGIGKLNYENYAVDGTHYTQDGYKLLAQAVLYNLGGNSTALMDSPDGFDVARYDYQTDEEGNYIINKPNFNNGIGSFKSWRCKGGNFIFDFDYKFSCSDGDPEYDMSQQNLGFRFAVGSNSLISPIGFICDSQWHHVRVASHRSTELVGRILMRLVNTTNLTLTDCVIKNLKIMSDDPEFLSTSDGDTIQIDNDYFIGSIVIERKDGFIKCNLDVTAKENGAPSYTTIVSNTKLKTYVTSGYKYFPLIVGSQTPARAQISDSGVLQLGVAVPANTRVINQFLV